MPPGSVLKTGSCSSKLLSLGGQIYDQNITEANCLFFREASRQGTLWGAEELNTQAAAFSLFLTPQKSHRLN